MVRVKTIGIPWRVLLLIWASLGSPAFGVFNCYDVHRAAGAEWIAPDVRLVLDAVEASALDIIANGRTDFSVEEYLARLLTARGITDSSHRRHFFRVWDRMELAALHHLDRNGWPGTENVRLDQLAREMGVHPWQAGLTLNQVYGNRTRRNVFLSQLLQWRLVEERLQARGETLPAAIRLVNYFEENHARKSVAEMRPELEAQGWTSQGQAMTELGIYQEMQNIGISLVDFWERSLPLRTERDIERRARNAGYALPSGLRSKGTIAAQLVPIVRAAHRDWTDNRIRTEIAQLIDVGNEPLSNYLHYVGALPHGEAWSPDESAIVARLHQDGVSIAALSRLLMRTESSVSAQLSAPSVSAPGTATTTAGPRTAKPHEILMKISLYPGSSDAEISAMFAPAIFRPVSLERVAFWRHRYHQGQLAPVVPATAAPPDLTGAEITARVKAGGEAAKQLVADIAIRQAEQSRDPGKLHYSPSVVKLKRATSGISYADFLSAFDGDNFAALLYTRQRARERGILGFTLLSVRLVAPKDGDPIERIHSYEAILTSRREDATRLMADWAEAQMEAGGNAVPRDPASDVPIDLSRYLGSSTAPIYPDPASGWLALRAELSRRGRRFPLYSVRIEGRKRTEEYMQELRKDALESYYRHVKALVEKGDRSSWWLTQSEFTRERKAELGFGWETLYRTDNEQVPIFENRDRFVEQYRAYVMEKEGIDIGVPLNRGTPK